MSRGRRSKKTPAERASALRQALNRSGFTPIEALRILWNWWGYPPMTIQFITGDVTITCSDYDVNKLEGVGYIPRTHKVDVNDGINAHLRWRKVQHSPSTTDNDLRLM